MLKYNDKYAMIFSQIFLVFGDLLVMFQTSYAFYFYIFGNLLWLIHCRKFKDMRSMITIILRTVISALSILVWKYYGR